MSDEKDDKWEMPKPVFRTTSGTLPKSFEATISQSFSPDPQVNEIVEDDDILSIMDKPSGYQAEKQAESFDDEAITLTPDATPQTGASQEASTTNPHHKPIVVTAKGPVEKAGNKSRNSILNIFLFVLIALMAMAIIVAIIYYPPN